jgi:predicted NUDIX family NTP pyrophosphohydrolase
MQISCGLLMYVRGARLRVLLGHPGGPYWRNKDAGAWSVPKGAPAPNEALFDAAQREFEEETGLAARGPFIALTPLEQPSRKRIHCWAFDGPETAPVRGASTFEIEWPPHSGQRAAFPEIDEARLFDVEMAMVKILPGQAPFITELIARLA